MTTPKTDSIETISDSKLLEWFMEWRQYWRHAGSPVLGARAVRPDTSYSMEAIEQEMERRQDAGIWILGE